MWHSTSRHCRSHSNSQPLLPLLHLSRARVQDLFAREHNAIAAMLAAAHRSYDDEKLYELARLTLVAVVAKIHTIDWTVELLKTGTMKVRAFGLVSFCFFCVFLGFAHCCALARQVGARHGLQQRLHSLCNE